MKCEICGNSNINIIYDDYIRDGAPGTHTNIKYKMYQCDKCGTIWHDHSQKENETYYESKEYRDKLEGTALIDDYYRLHDFEVLDKFNYCGTTIFRNKTVADIGCGGGGFLDFLAGVSSDIVAIEPSLEYRNSLKKRGYHAYPYASDALPEWNGKIDVVTSFDVIEHVDDPIAFMKDVYDLLGEGGRGIIGTPTDCPVMRKLLGHVYEQKLLYSFQHIWILSKEGFELCCQNAGFKKVRIEFVQRYGLSNLVTWVAEREPKGHVEFDFVSKTLDSTYRRELEKQGLGDYIIAHVEK